MEILSEGQPILGNPNFVKFPIMESFEEGKL
jgi:hypothetical protein